MLHPGEHRASLLNQVYSPFLLTVYWHLALLPTLAIALTMLGFSFLGDGLRDALDPKQEG